MKAWTVILATARTNANILNLQAISYFFHFKWAHKNKTKYNPCSICENTAIQEHSHWYQVFNTGTKREIFQTEMREGYSHRWLQSRTLIDSLHVLNPKPVFKQSPAFSPLSDWTFSENCCFTTWKKDGDSKGVIERDEKRRRKAKENEKERIKVLAAALREAYQRANNKGNR